MTKYLLAAAICFFSLSFSGTMNTPIDRMGVKGPLVFDKTPFALSWSDHPSETYYIQEYLPAGEKTEHFNQLLTLHLFDNDIPLKNAVDQKIQELNQRKTTDALCHYMITQKPGGSEFMVDFILSESKGTEMTIAEFNIYRFKTVQLGKRKGILVYAYSKRSYGDNITGFLKKLKTERPVLLNVMGAVQIPAVMIVK
ncbi:hypothetical protein BH11BAC4_BH11BAC4_25920 [soil metagenome]